MADISRVNVEGILYDLEFEAKTINGESIFGSGNIPLGGGQKILFEGSMLVSTGGSETAVHLPQGWQVCNIFTFVVEKAGSTYSYYTTLLKINGLNYSFREEQGYIFSGRCDWDNGIIYLRCGEHNDLYGTPTSNSYYIKLITGA